MTPALPRLVASQAPSAGSTPAQEQHDQDYSAYDSPFKWYPLLGSRARPLYTNSIPEAALVSSSPSFFSTSNSSSLPSSSLSLSSFTPTSSSSSASSLSFSPSVASVYSSHGAFYIPDLKPLKLATASKMLDPSKRVCQFEVPGGGVCRDEGCEDMHLSRIAGQDGHGGAEPSDEDTAEYLINTMPSDWLTNKGVSQSKMSSVLQQIRLKNPHLAFEERVAHTLAALGPPLPP
ncbi:hypothetical protein D9615_002893 [Tricholomella constricta]|uniref:Zinc-finger domain-containing protein n=1 Tax=Tricholomella constricta TaxID=117010 RepID=A0A8H5HGV9_9AGAR|nr:hypothetical protein D9615_002893 [Tricholomella constricta]